MRKIFILFGGVLVVVGIGVTFLLCGSSIGGSSRPKNSTSALFLPALLREVPSFECDSLVGNLANKIEAGMGLDIVRGEIFWEKESDKPCRIASLTKLMVVLIAMDEVSDGEIKVSDIITGTKEASQMGGSQIYLKEGEKFALQELLKSMMIVSANDAAYSVAQYIGGTAAEFVKKMNNTAAKMGLEHTYFSNPTGLPPNEGEWPNVSTCVDMAQIALQVIKYPKVMEWAGTDVDYIRDGEFKLHNWNSLIRKCDFVDGLKTGFYREAGYNIVATSINGDKKIIAIVFGAKTPKIRDQVAKCLIEYKLHGS
ncbi:MAG: D-alanyl-D-alanine carboxypeptidase [Candidatus Stahlbacteria bacterium]|nr:D-alanyl-D-alanine carboxypeptidase [Candidatus Stahlbacteria bacterium]